MINHEYEFWQMLDKLVAECEIIVDRPKGSHHPKYKEYVYPLDYGFLSGTSAADGGGIDVWIGTSPIRLPTAIISTIDSLKKDAEIKILYACTKDEIKLAHSYHNSTTGMKGILNIRTDIKID